MTQAQWCDFLLLVLWVYGPLPYQIPAVRSSILSEQDVLLFVFRNRTHLKCKPCVLKVWFASFVFQICGRNMAPLSSCDCPHLDCVGEVTKEELIQKSHVSDAPSWPSSWGQGVCTTLHYLWFKVSKVSHAWYKWVFSYIFLIFVLLSKSQKVCNKI